MDVYFSDQVNDPTLRLFSSTKTLGADSLDESITLKFEDDPVMSAAISAATGGSLMDISDIMQDRESDKASENHYEDMHEDAQINTNNYNGGEKLTSPVHQAHALNKSMNSGNTGSSSNNGPTRGGTPIGMNATNDYDDGDDIKPPMAHAPIYMPQHHNIDQVSYHSTRVYRLPFNLIIYFMYLSNVVFAILEQFPWKYVQRFPQSTKRRKNG